MIPLRLNLIEERLKGPTIEQLRVGNQWAITALDRFHADSMARFEFDIDGIGSSAIRIWESSFSTAAMRERKDMANHGGVAIAMFIMSVILDYGYVETKPGTMSRFRAFWKRVPAIRLKAA